MKKKIQEIFINDNTKFWRHSKEPDSKKLLLVETSSHPVINHANAVVGKMIAQAKNLRIAWIKHPRIPEEIMRSYSQNSIFLDFPPLDLLTRFCILLLSTFYYFFYVLVKNNPLSFKFQKIPYGDFVYDGYLSKYSMATLHRPDSRIIIIFYRLLLNHQKARLILNKNPIKAILVSHYVGLSSGPLSRVAMQMNIPVYWKGRGHATICLAVFNKLGQIYNFPRKPTKKIIDLLIKKHKKSVEADFKEFIKRVNSSSYYGAFSVAYNNVIFSEVTRESFLKRMNLSDKPIVFIMLHAFNDKPHSHFKEMLFNDYYDWFLKTFHFAKKDKSKNWIIKEHPVNRFYKTKDLNLKKMMEKLPRHIRFVSQDSNIKASTVLNVADVIITCIGTAGVEMPALRGIPSIIAGNTFFDGLGFTVEPKSKKEYFEILKNLSLKPLSPKQQLKAKSCYLYLNKYSVMPFAAGPAITFKESTKPHDLESTYPIRILRAYKKDKRLITAQFNRYLTEIRKKNFQYLSKWPRQ
jgi:hypothetical protein